MGELIEGLTGHVDWKEQAALHLAGARASYEAILANPLTMDERIHHVNYQDFVADPVATIRGFYEKYGVPFTADADAAMCDYLANNRNNRYGKFRYSTEVIGADIGSLHEEFAPYRERFGVQIEQRK